MIQYNNIFNNDNFKCIAQGDGEEDGLQIV